MPVDIPGGCTMSFEPLVSDADLSAKVGYFAKRGTGWALGTDNDGIGVIADGGAALGDMCTVCFGEVMVLAGGTVAIGALVSCDGTARAIAAVSGDAPVGRALSAGAIGQWMRIFIYGVVDESVA